MNGVGVRRTRKCVWASATKLKAKDIHTLDKSRHKSVLRRYKGGMREVLGDGTIHPYRVVHEHVLW